MGYRYASLTDPPAGSPVTQGFDWILGTTLGSLATIVACLAVAAIGLLMLSGRIELKRGITVVLGCFILFGARTIAGALVGHGAAHNETRGHTAMAVERSPLQPVVPQRPGYDPYAGASVPVR